MHEFRLCSPLPEVLDAVLSTGSQDKDIHRLYRSTLTIPDNIYSVGETGRHSSQAFWQSKPAATPPVSGAGYEASNYAATKLGKPGGLTEACTLIANIQSNLKEGSERFVSSCKNVAAATS